MPQFLYHPDHDLYTIDFHVVYELRTYLHAELYALGLRMRIHRLIPFADVGMPAPGVLALSRCHHDAYHTALSAVCNSAADYARGWTRDMRASIRDVVRGNLHFEQGNISPDTLVQVAVNMMIYTNLNDDLDTIGALQNLLPEQITALLYDALTPVVTPYLMVLAQRTRALLDHRTSAEEARYRRDAAFLQQFDSPAHDTNPISVQDVQLHVSSFPPALRQDRRRQATRKLVTLFPPVAGLLCLAQVAADHEEARHYWQGRTLRNLRHWMRGVGLDPYTATLQDIHDVMHRVHV